MTSEVAHNDAIAKCRPGTGAAGTGAYIGVGPCQNLTYIGALRPRLAIICDSRLDNLIEHLMFKMLIERATNPLDYLLLLFSRPVEEPPPSADIKEAEDLVAAFERGTPDPETYRDNLEWLRSEAKRRWEFNDGQLDRLSYLYGQFFARQLAITAVNQECAEALGSPTLRDVILARNSYRRNFHFLTDADRFAYVRQMQLEDRIIPMLGNFSSAASIQLINDLLDKFGERADTIYLSNIEDYLVSRYLLDSHGVASEPNPDGLLKGVYTENYAQFIDHLSAIHTAPDTFLIRFIFQGERWGRTVGEDLEPTVSRLKTFLAAYRRGAESLLDTCL
ncbi:LIC_10091 family protein [Nonomuraea sp. 10N515B]|uniref:LIC_10091 family protein n=1 Tax=Nonomuraea sp. 10N515B TaxID=3457422 RepID=UPI003FCD48C3